MLAADLQSRPIVNSMNSQTYRRLEEIFSEFNESIILLYSSLIDLYPPDKRGILLEVLKVTLTATGDLYRKVSKDLFELR